MPCPHFSISLVKRSLNQSAVAGAAYQSGEPLFSEYDQKRKSYSEKRGIVHAEILLPAHAPPEYADRATLWNAVEAVEKQWNSQLARRIILALPREVPPDQYAQMLRDYCNEHFVSKGMCVDFAIHDKGDGNPHAHIMLTMRAMDADGKWLPKIRKVYDLDENGNRVKCENSRYWKSHKEDTVDWNDQKYAEIWRHGWETVTNRYLERNSRPERVDLRSFERQGTGQIPTVHMGVAATQMEKRGISTFLGDLNRDIRAANSLMQSIGNRIRSLKAWVTELNGRMKLFLSEMASAPEPGLAELLFKYLSAREDERDGWSGISKIKGLSNDVMKVQHSIDYLNAQGISTLDDLDRRLDAAKEKSAGIRKTVKSHESKIKNLTGIITAHETCERLKPVMDAYGKIWFKGKKEKYANEHKDDLAAYRKAARYLKQNRLEPDSPIEKAKLLAECGQHREAIQAQQAELESVQADLKEMKDVRYFISKVLPEQEKAGTEKSVTEPATKIAKTKRHAPKPEPQERESVLAQLRQKQQAQKNRDQNRETPGQTTNRKKEMEI